MQEATEIRREGIPIAEDGMVRVDGVNRGDGLLETSVRCIRGFVEDIVSGKPWVALILLCKFFPKLDGKVLEILVNPEGCKVDRVI
jgi:hypothetical protein